jgi:hypothetical protein
MKKTTIAALLLATIFFSFTTPENKKRIVIDPRVMSDKAVSVTDPGYTIAEKLKTQLEAKGFEVYITTNSSEALILEQRIAFTQQKQPDLYISLSCYNVDHTKYGRRKITNVEENYKIYPVAGAADLIDEAKTLSVSLQTQLTKERNTTAQIFSMPWYYDIKCAGLVLSTEYKPGTAFQQKLSDNGYQNSLTAAIAASVEEYLD